MWKMQQRRSRCEVHSHSLSNSMFPTNVSNLFPIRLWNLFPTNVSNLYQTCILLSAFKLQSQSYPFIFVGHTIKTKNISKLLFCVLCGNYSLRIPSWSISVKCWQSNGKIFSCVVKVGGKVKTKLSFPIWLHTEERWQIKCKPICLSGLSSRNRRAVIPSQNFN